VLKSWLITLNTVRNICAHHGRLWNRELGTKPRIPRQKRYPAWHVPVEVNGDRVFAVLTICAYCMGRVSPGSSWPRRLEELLRKHPRIPRGSMGFPNNWIESPLWKNAVAS
jgi:abortive infection bacteriophage resistance protein